MNSFWQQTGEKDQIEETGALGDAQGVVGTLWGQGSQGVSLFMSPFAVTGQAGTLSGGFGLPASHCTLPGILLPLNKGSKQKQQGITTHLASLVRAASGW